MGCWWSCAEEEVGFAEYGLMDLGLAACGVEAVAGTDGEKGPRRRSK